MESETGLVETRKNNKRNHILSTVRYHAPLSRHDVKKRTGYSMTTVLNTIGELVDRSLLAEEECVDVRAGRRPVWLRICPQGAYTVGVEFNADRLACVVTDFSYHTIYTAHSPVRADADAEALLDGIVQAVRGAMDALGTEREKVAGIGVGLPGYLDRTGGVGLEYAYLPGWKNVPVRETLAQTFGCRVFVENNVNTMACAYRWRTYAEQAEDFLFLSLKHGLRMGLYSGNRLFTGNGNAGEIAHVRVAGSSRFCSCGRRGCLDAEVSLHAIRAKTAERMACGRFAALAQTCGGDARRVTMAMLADAAQSGDADALDLLQETAACLGQALGSVVGALNPRRIILAEDSGMGGTLFSGLLRDALAENVPPVLLQDVSVQCIAAPPHMGAEGAAMLAMEGEFSPVFELV